MEDDQKQPPKTPNAEPEITVAASISSVEMKAVSTVPSTGRRQSFRNIARQLTDVELAHPGVHKLILEDWEKAETECENLRTYVDKFHEADKKCAVLEEQIKSNRAMEILFSVCLSLGSILLGATPYFWDGGAKGIMIVSAGIVLMIGAVISRVFKG
jgi:hypothetical protein